MSGKINYNQMMDRFFGLIAKYIEENPELIEELQNKERMFANFKIDGNEKQRLLLDWFVFDSVSETLSENLLKYLLKTDILTAGEKTVYSRLLNGVYSIFTVKAIRTGKEMIICDLIHNKEYQVMDTTFTRNIHKGDCAIMRVLPFNDFFILSGMGYILPSDASPVIKLFMKENRMALHNGKLTPLTIWRIFYEQETPERLPPDERLILIGMECGMERKDVVSVIGQLKQQADARGSHHEIVEDFFRKINPCEGFSTHELSETFVELWNYFITEKAPSAVKGPLERTLVQIAIGYVQARVKPENYKNIEDAQKKAQTLNNQWLKTPKEELGGQTPIDLILQERKELGNPQKEIGFSTQFSLLEPGQEVEEKAKRLFYDGVEKMNEQKPKESLKAYRQYCGLNPNNHVVWHNMAVAHFYLDELEKARSCLKRALSIDPDYEMAKSKLKMLDQEK